MKPVTLIASLVISFSAAAIGSLATVPNISTWYAALDKPFFNPPNWVFGPVWTILYILIGVSLYLLWTRQARVPKKRVMYLFAAQLILNALWCITFFGLHLPWLGLIVISLLLSNIIALIISAKKISPIAAYLLIPYALWVSFALCLNLAMAILN